MKIAFVELPEVLREGGLEKAAADMAHYLTLSGTEVKRGLTAQDSLEGFDLIHFHGLWSPMHFQVARACYKRGLATVVSPHGMLEPWAWRHRRWKKWPYFHLVEKHRLRRARALLATAEEESRNLRRFFPDTRIDVLPLGIEPDVHPRQKEARRELGWNDDERILLYLSRVHEKKGLKELLEALLVIRDEGLENNRLVIVGDGPKEYVNTCRRLSADLEKTMPVDWVAPKWGPEKWPYLQGADLFCLPTYSENFGIVVLEAGIVGTPVFTTTGTPWRILSEKGLGWVVDPDPSQYAQTLKSFLNMPDDELTQMRRRIAEWTRTEYAWPNLVKRYQSFYEGLPGEKQDA